MKLNKDYVIINIALGVYIRCDLKHYQQIDILWNSINLLDSSAYLFVAQYGI